MCRIGGDEFAIIMVEMNPSPSIFTDADKALYHIKENGKHGCGFYGIPEENKE